MAKRKEAFTRKDKKSQELEIQRKRAEISERRLDQSQDDQEFVSPESGRYAMASQTPGFTTSEGTNAGGLAYNQGHDFGTNVSVPYEDDRIGGLQRGSDVSYGKFVPQENLEQYRLKDFYGDVSKLNTLGEKLAAADIDINDPNFMDEDEMEMVRQWNDLYNDILERQNNLRTGYEARKSHQEKGQRTESHQGTTGFDDFYKDDMFDKDVSELNRFAKETYSRNSQREANSILFGPGGTLESAMQNRSGRVGEQFAVADALERSGKTGQANLLRRKMLDVLGSTYNSVKQQELGLKREELERKKLKDANDLDLKRKSKSSKYKSAEDLEKKIFQIRHHGNIGLIRQVKPDARYENIDGVQHITYTEGLPPQKVVMNIDDDEEIIQLLDPKKTGVTLEEFQEVRAERGPYIPSEEEDKTIKVDFDRLDNLWNDNIDPKEIKGYLEEVSEYLIDKRGNKISISDEGSFDSGLDGLIDPDNTIVVHKDGKEEARFEVRNQEGIDGLKNYLKNNIDISKSANKVLKEGDKYHFPTDGSNSGVRPFIYTTEVFGKEATSRRRNEDNAAPLKIQTGESSSETVVTKSNRDPKKISDVYKNRLSKKI